MQILKQLRDLNISIEKIHHIVLSHKHTDHILGLFWIIRYFSLYSRETGYKEKIHVYMHKELESTIRKIVFEVLPKKFTNLIDNEIVFDIVENNQIVKILNYDVKFLDIFSTKDKQFGFKTTLENGKSLVFLGDETFNEVLREEVKNSDWLLHEAFCLDSEAEIFKPYEKMHSTAKTAAQIAESLNVKNLVLYHTNDNDLKNRRALYTNEARQYFNGNIYVPDDLDIIEL